MVSYEYQELFYKQHQTKDFLIVDANATITPVTGEAPTVSGATIEIHTADIESEVSTAEPILEKREFPIR